MEKGSVDLQKEKYSKIKKIHWHFGHSRIRMGSWIEGAKMAEIHKLKTSLLSLK